MDVGEIMNKDILYLAKDNTIEKAIDIILRHCRSGLAVVDDECKVCGFVSEEDIIKKCLPGYLSTLKNAACLPDCGQFARRFARFRNCHVSEIMNPKPVCIKTDISDFAAAAEMIRRHLKVCPVVDAENHLVGYVSRPYLIRAMVTDKNRLENKTLNYE